MGEGCGKIQAITACAFIHKDSKLLLARRAATKAFLPGEFELPGGHIEFGEEMEEGLKREIKEELHLDVRIGEPFYAFTYISQNKTKHSVEVDYFATLSNQDQKIILNPEDHSEYRWVTREEIEEGLPISGRELLAIKKGFQIIGSAKKRKS